jgi:triphosphoribosyl-dephospho-CoA synthetase
MNPVKKVIAKLHLFQKESANKSEEDIFRTIHALDEQFSDDEIYKLNINGVIINIGTDRKSNNLLNHAIKRLEALEGKMDPENYFFDLGNAHLSIADISLGQNPKIEDLIKNKDYKEARRCFYQSNLPSAATNAANILEMYYRNFEAILQYDRALKANSKFGMALGNKGIALTFYYNLAKKKNPEILLESRDLLKKGLKEATTSEIGGTKAISTFQRYLNSLEDFIQKHKIEYSPKSSSVVPDPYLCFCSNRNAFLNFCFNCYKCQKGFVDDFFPPFIESIKETSSDERATYHSFSRRLYFSIKTLNQIIEDYATARHIYFLAESEDFEMLDSYSIYRSALDYCRNSIKYGYLKTAFIKLYNILDKIAHLVFYYHKIERSEVYFSSLQEPSFSGIIISTDNKNLLALNNLAWDFEQNGIYYHLKQIRHLLTHDFIDIKEDMFDPNETAENLSEHHHLTEQLLCGYLDELMILVKAGIMYFIQALESEIKKIKKEPGQACLDLDILTQDYIFGKTDNRK